MKNLANYLENYLDENDEVKINLKRINKETRDIKENYKKNNKKFKNIE